MNDYQKALLILEAACAAYADRLAKHVAAHEDEIAGQAIGGETTYHTDQMVELTERLREHTMALAGLHDWSHVWLPRRVVIVTADPSGVAYTEGE